ncbi:unnamed protein product, partial [Iphiclides podalirius]
MQEVCKVVFLVALTLNCVETESYTGRETGSQSHRTVSPPGSECTYGLRSERFARGRLEGLLNRACGCIALSAGRPSLQRGETHALHCETQLIARAVVTHAVV